MEFKRNVRELREKSSCLDLVFLVDESSSVGANNFLSELRFIRKMLSDFPVAPENTRVALVTFSSKTHVVTRVDHISAPKSHQHKCSLFNQEIPAINYRGGGTYTKGAFQRAAVSQTNGLMINGSLHLDIDPKLASHFFSLRPAGCMCVCVHAWSDCGLERLMLMRPCMALLLLFPLNYTPADSEGEAARQLIVQGFPVIKIP